MSDAMRLSSIQKSLLVAAYFRGGSPEDLIWISSSDQVVILSLFYTGHISLEDCVERFSLRGYISGLYGNGDELCKLVGTRYEALIEMIREFPEFIEGGGDLETPAFPTYTACRLTFAGQKIVGTLIPSFPRKPEFPNWPDRRTYPIER